MKGCCIPHQPKCSSCSQVPQPPDQGTNHLSESTRGPDSGSKSRCEPIPWDMVFENGGTCIDLNPKKWSNPAWTLTSTIFRLWLGAQISMVNWIIAFSCSYRKNVWSWKWKQSVAGPSPQIVAAAWSRADSTSTRAPNLARFEILMDRFSFNGRLGSTNCLVSFGYVLKGFLRFSQIHRHAKASSGRFCSWELCLFTS
jgi:hypothetical protein